MPMRNSNRLMTAIAASNSTIRFMNATRCSIGSMMAWQRCREQKPGEHVEGEILRFLVSLLAYSETERVAMKPKTRTVGKREFPTLESAVRDQGNHRHDDDGWLNVTLGIPGTVQR